jgi:acyl carrier protein
MTNAVENEAVRSTVLRAVVRKLSVAGRERSDIGERTKLLELGLIDSEDLIEIIIEVEEQCGCEFDPSEMDLETGLTLGGLVGAFVARG